MVVLFCRALIGSRIESVLLGPYFFLDYASMGLKTHNIGADPQTHWYSGAPPGKTNTGSMFKTKALIQGTSCAS